MIIRRLLTTIVLLLAVSFAVFSLELFLPGDPAVTLAGEGASPERVAEIREELRLDRPLLERYVGWVTDAVRGDFGRSLFTRRPVAGEVAARLAVTLSLVAGAVVFALLIGGPAGVLAGRRRDGPADQLASFGASLGVSVPHFVIGIILVVVLSLWLGWLPTGGYVRASQSLTGWLRHLVIPSLALSGIMAAELARQVRSALHHTLDQDYIRTAYAKGLRETTVVLRHGLLVAATPAVSVLSVQTARLFGAAVIVEEVFRIPGLGRLTVQAILHRDLPVLQGVIPVAVLIAVATALLADLVQTGIDPRLRRGTRSAT